MADGKAEQGRRSERKGTDLLLIIQDNRDCLEVDLHRLLAAQAGGLARHAVATHSARHAVPQPLLTSKARIVPGVLPAGRWRHSCKHRTWSSALAQRYSRADDETRRQPEEALWARPHENLSFGMLGHCPLRTDSPLHIGQSVLCINLNRYKKSNRELARYLEQRRCRQARCRVCVAAQPKGRRCPSMMRCLAGPEQARQHPSRPCVPVLPCPSPVHPHQGPPAWSPGGILLSKCALMAGDTRHSGCARSPGNTPGTARPAAVDTCLHARADGISPAAMQITSASVRSR